MIRNTSDWKSVNVNVAFQPWAVWYVYHKLSGNTHLYVRFGKREKWLKWNWKKK